MDDQAVEQIGRIVDRHHHPLADRLGKRADAFLTRRSGAMFCCSNSLCVLNRIELDLERQFVLQVGADLLIGALGVPGDPFEVLFDLPGRNRSRSARSRRSST